MEALAEMASDTEENTPKALGLLGDLESDSEGGLNDLQDLGDLGDDVDMGFHGLADLRGDWEQEEGDKMQDELPMEAAEWDEPLDGQQQDIPDTVRDKLWLARKIKAALAKHRSPQCPEAEDDQEITFVGISRFQKKSSEIPEAKPAEAEQQSSEALSAPHLGGQAWSFMSASKAAELVWARESASERIEKQNALRATLMWRYKKHRDEALAVALAAACPLMLLCASVRVKWDETTHTLKIPSDEGHKLSLTVSCMVMCAWISTTLLHNSPLPWVCPFQVLQQNTADCMWRALCKVLPKGLLGDQRDHPLHSQVCKWFWIIFVCDGAKANKRLLAYASQCLVQKHNGALICHHIMTMK